MILDAHVVVACFDLGAAVEDAVGDRVGPWAAIESAGPVLLPVLRAEDGARSVFSALHDLVDEPAHMNAPGLSMNHSSNEDPVAADFADEFGGAPGLRLAASHCSAISGMRM